MTRATRAAVLRLAACLATGAAACAAAPTPRQEERRVACNDAASASEISLQLRVPVKVGVGAHVPLRLVILNGSANLVEMSLAFPGPGYRMAIFDDAGKLVWSSMPEEEPRFDSARLAQIAPSDSMSFELVWGQVDDSGASVGPGLYRVVGNLLANVNARVPLKPAECAIRIVKQP